MDVRRGRVKWRLDAGISLLLSCPYPMDKSVSTRHMPSVETSEWCSASLTSAQGDIFKIKLLPCRDQTRDRCIRGSESASAPQRGRELKLNIWTCQIRAVNGVVEWMILRVMWRGAASSFVNISILYQISRKQLESEPGFEPRTSGFLARSSTNWVILVLMPAHPEVRGSNPGSG